MWTYPTVVLENDATSMPSGPGGKDLFRCEPSPGPALAGPNGKLKASCLLSPHGTQAHPVQLSPEPPFRCGDRHRGGPTVIARAHPRCGSPLIHDNKTPYASVHPILLQLRGSPAYGRVALMVQACFPGHCSILPLPRGSKSTSRCPRRHRQTRGRSSRLAATY